MKRFLLIDVGAGTMDVLYLDASSGKQYKAVVASPVQTVAETVHRFPGHLIVTGGEMGGGPVSRALIDRAAESRVVMTRSASATLHHDLDKVRSWGVEVVEDDAADAYLHDASFAHLVLGDLEPDRLERIVTAFGVPFAFDAVGFCAQDHGWPPAGVSHLDFRHALFRARIDRLPQPQALLFAQDRIPPEFNRLRCAARVAEALPTEAVFVMDSGMAAILGATMDPKCDGAHRRIVLDVATSHTVVAAMEGDDIAGFVEYHTRDLTRDRLESLIRELADGRVSHKRILEEGGHGAYLRSAFGFDRTDILLATGPKRSLLNGTRLPVALGAPLGDNMMTGTAGLMEAIRRHAAGTGPPNSHL